MNLFSLFTRRSRSSTRRPRLAVEALEGRELMSAMPLTPPNDLSNGLVRKIASHEFVQDGGQLTRTDVIDLINVVEQEDKAVFSANGQVSFEAAQNPLAGTLKGKQLANLRTLARDAALWGMADDVANLLGKLVNYNVANKSINEGPNQTPTTILTSGKLAAGDADRLMYDLEGKWFFGTDLPSLQNATGGHPASYEYASGSLFGPGGPKASDVAQGLIGDCYFLSALGETAERDPRAIRDMFTNNHDGTFTVRFFDNGVADYVTVNRELPVSASANFLFADRDADGATASYTNSTNVLWVALAEKAYAQLAQEGWSRSRTGGSGVSTTPSDWNQNAYNALNYGSTVTLEQITGATLLPWQDFRNANNQVIPSAQKELINAWQKGDLVLLWSYGSEPTNMPKDAAGAALVVPYHVYMLSGYNAQTGLFTLTNPYADGDVKHSGGEGTRTVTLDWHQLTTYLEGFAFVDAAQVN